MALISPLLAAICAVTLPVNDVHERTTLLPYGSFAGQHHVVHSEQSRSTLQHVLNLAISSIVQPFIDKHIPYTQEVPGAEFDLPTAKPCLIPNPFGGCACNGKVSTNVAFQKFQITRLDVLPKVTVLDLAGDDNTLRVPFSLSGDVAGGFTFATTGSGRFCPPSTSAEGTLEVNANVSGTLVIKASVGVDFGLTQGLGLCLQLLAVEAEDVTVSLFDPRTTVSSGLKAAQLLLQSLASAITALGEPLASTLESTMGSVVQPHLASLNAYLPDECNRPVARVCVFNASGLPKTDGVFTKSSPDPYAYVSLEAAQPTLLGFSLYGIGDATVSNVFRTRVVDDTTAPEWDECVTLESTSRTAFVRVVVYDSDLGGVAYDTLGRAFAPQNVSGAYSLQLVSSDIVVPPSGGLPSPPCTGSGPCVDFTVETLPKASAASNLHE